MQRRRLLQSLTAASTAAAAQSAWTNPYLKEFHHSFVEHWKDTREYTLAVLDAMPADGFTLKPHPTQRTFGEQLIHLAIANVAYFRTFDLVPLPGAIPADRQVLEKTVDAADKDAVRRFVAACIDYVAAVLDKAGEKDFQRRDLNLRNKPHSATDICFRAYMHTAHHRGQIITYLRVKGVTPPAWKFEPTVG